MVTVVLDDNDAHIKYSGTWFKAGGPGEYGSTTHGTRAGGAKATFIFSGTTMHYYLSSGPSHLMLTRIFRRGLRNHTQQ